MSISFVISEMAPLYSLPLLVKLRNVSPALVFSLSMAFSTREIAVSMKSNTSMDSFSSLPLDPDPDFPEPDFPDFPDFPEPPVPPDFA